MKSVVVTGVSTGIGWGCVKVLIESGFRVFGSVRKQTDAERLTKEFGPNFTPLIFDVTDKATVAKAAKEVEAALGDETLLGLINNAGVAVVGPLISLGIEEFEHQLAVNLTGPLIVTQAFKGLLSVDRSRRGAPGRIVMISSVGGKNAMSESLRRELMIFGVDVIVVAPGTIATPIWNKADAVDVTPFADTSYAPALARLKAYMISNGNDGLPPERIGETVKTALTVKRPKTRYTVTPNPLQNLLALTLPKRLVDGVIARRLGLRA